MSIAKLKARDLLLLILYTEGAKPNINEPISGRTRLLKMIVAFEEELFDDFKKGNDILQKEDLPEFFAWNFGPMSTEVLGDLEFFIKIKFIETKEVNSLSAEEVEEISAIANDMFLDKNEEEEYTEKEYSLSNIGKKYVEERLIDLLTENQKNLLRKLKKQFNSASLYKILSYIYNNEKYKKYINKDKSKIYSYYKK